jgi:hypothetical protein
MTYKELYEAIKPFALDKVYNNDEVEVFNSGYDGKVYLKVISVDEDGQIEVG